MLCVSARWTSGTATWDRKNRLLRLARGRPGTKTGVEYGGRARDQATGVRLFASLARHSFQIVCPDYDTPYRRLIPLHLHYRSKAETTSVESCNRLLHQYLARFRRKPSATAKCKHML
jgi:IS1 family transposase